MKMFLLFQCDDYYPSGGWKDFKGAFFTLDEALSNVSNSYDRYQVVDLETMTVIESGRLNET